MSEKSPSEIFEEKDVIRLGVGRPPIAKCSCGWETEPSPKLYDLASLAFEHSADTGHVLRKHEEMSF